MEELTLLSMAGAGLYLLASMTCILAGSVQGQVTDKKRKKWFWFVIAVAFVLLAVSRIFGIEEAISLGLKAEFIAKEEYSQRRGWQRWFVAGALLIAAGFCFWLLRRSIFRKSPGSWRQNLVILAVIGLGTIVLLRIISFHATDKLLYGLRLNWILDPGLTLLVIAMALLTVRELREKRLI